MKRITDLAVQKMGLEKKKTWLCDGVDLDMMLTVTTYRSLSVHWFLITKLVGDENSRVCPTGFSNCTTIGANDRNWLQRLKHVKESTYQGY